MDWSSKRGSLEEKIAPSKAKFLLRQKKAGLKIAKAELSSLGREKPKTQEAFQQAANRLSSIKKQIVSLRADVISLSADSKKKP